MSDSQPKITIIGLAAGETPTLVLTVPLTGKANSAVEDLLGRIFGVTAQDSTAPRGRLTDDQEQNIARAFRAGPKKNK